MGKKFKVIFYSTVDSRPGCAAWGLSPKQSSYNLLLFSLYIMLSCYKHFLYLIVHTY